MFDALCVQTSCGRSQDCCVPLVCALSRCAWLCCVAMPPAMQYCARRTHTHTTVSGAASIPRAGVRGRLPSSRRHGWRGVGSAAKLLGLLVLAGAYRRRGATPCARPAPALFGVGLVPFRFCFLLWQTHTHHTHTHTNVTHTHTHTHTSDDSNVVCIFIDFVAGDLFNTHLCSIAITHICI